MRSLDGFLREFEYQIDGDRFLRIVSLDREKPEALDAQVLKYDKQTAVVAIDARIDARALVVDLVDRRAPARRSSSRWSWPTCSAARSTSTPICSPGDSFRVLFEKSSHDGQFSGYGAILGASITVDGRQLQAFRWEDPATGKAGYYDENGRSLKRFFLKSPLKFEPRVTSGFSTRRFHPIDQVFKAHLGVDYGAPTGSSVVAVAAGVVVSAVVQRRRRQHGAPETPGRLRDLLSAPLGLRSRDPRRHARRAGTVDRPRRHDRFGDRPASRLPPQAQRRLRQPGRRALTPGARRADSRRAARDLQVVARHAAVAPVHHAPRRSPAREARRGPAPSPSSR